MTNIKRLLWSCLVMILSPLAALAQDMSGIAAQVDGGVAYVEVSTRSSTGSGTGFVIGTAPGRNSYYLVTNEHVAGGATDIVVLFVKDEQLHIYGAEIIRESSDLDLSLLRITRTSTAAHEPVVLPIADRELNRGESVFALGYPAASQRLQTDDSAVERITTTFTAGTLSRVYGGRWSRSRRDFQILEHTAKNPRKNRKSDRKKEKKKMKKTRKIQ